MTLKVNALESTDIIDINFSDNWFSNIDVPNFTISKLEYHKSVLNDIIIEDMNNFNFSHYIVGNIFYENDKIRYIIYYISNETRISSALNNLTLNDFLLDQIGFGNIHMMNI